LRDWLSRLEQKREQAMRAADETVYRTWRLYMTAAALEFEKGTVNVNQSLFERTLPGFRGIPSARADLYV
jgi:cyclopropane-fatty-acyl-phospholipid synthase